MTDYAMISEFEGRRHYVAGERVSCMVTLKCPQDIVESDNVDNVALHAVAVQLVGVFAFNEQWCAPPYVAPEPKNRQTFFPPVLPTLARNERVIFASPVCIVGEHLVFPVHAIYRFSFSEVLPKEIPPSYNGALGSFYYRVVVSYYKAPPTGVIDLVNDNYRSTFFNIKVVSPLSMVKCIRHPVEYNSSNPIVEYGERITNIPRDGPLTVAEKDIRDALFEPVHEVQKRYSQQICVNVMDNNAFIVRVVLPRTVLLPGQTLYGMCDFRGGEVLCQAMEVFIATEETVDPDIAYSKNVLRVSKDTYGAQSCNCSCLELVPLSVTIPHDVTPEFTTKLTSLRWMLVLRFHTVPNPERVGIELNDPKVIDFSFTIHVVSQPE